MECGPIEVQADSTEEALNQDMTCLPDDDSPSGKDIDSVIS